MTVYNREEFIADAIESVLASDFTDFELIIVDDCSEDRSVRVAQSYAEKDDRLKVFVNTQNNGDYPNRNKAASLATGTYLKYVDSDDMIYPWGLSVMVRCMEKFPDAGFGLSARAEYDRPHPIQFEPEATYRENFLGRELFGRAPGSAIIRRSAFEAVGGFSGVRDVGDMEFWLKIGARYPLVLLTPALVWDRIHPGQEKNVNSAGERAALRVKVIIAALSHPHCPLTQEERVRALDIIRQRETKFALRTVLRQGRMFAALRHIRTVISPLAAARTGS
ncbi:hypothetical protein C1J05_06055 [Sulfitobacter sp. JL08]|nr:hypothetical protein C1J05_06055 [Sulfitobacter sp. JL08]